MRIVLASQSASRLGILRAAGVEPVVHPAHIDESSNDPLALAEAKAAKVAGEYPDDVVIGCDSMLLLGGTLQGKPHTVDATVDRWRAQAGQTAELVTGHCVIYRGARFTEEMRTTVRFGEPTEADIAAYAATGEPLEVAGAFTLESLGGWFIDRIDGDPSSVVGLSLPLVRRALYSFKLDVRQFWR